jgi:hypothetical protein
MIKKYKNLIIILVILAIAVFIWGIWYIGYLNKAHSTFDNYYAFRGCVELLERTDTYGICKTNSGQTIKIVKYQGKWFLDGDLPMRWFNFL